MALELPVGDITSANATLILTVEDLFPQGVQLYMFATDQSLSMGELTVAETRMGVDGNLVAGFVPNPKEVNIMLEAASPSYASLATLYRATEQKRGIYQCTLIATVPSISQVYTWTAGVMVKGTPVPPFKKVLDPTSWTFHFARLTIAGV